MKCTWKGLINNNSKKFQHITKTLCNHKSLKFNSNNSNENDIKILLGRNTKFKKELIIIFIVLLKWKENQYSM